MEEFALDVALSDIQKYKDPNNTDPIDEKDVAFMYLVGFVTGAKARRRDPMPTEPDFIKRCALYIRHFYCQEGYNDRCHELHGGRVLRSDQFRLSLE